MIWTEHNVHSYKQCQCSTVFDDLHETAKIVSTLLFHAYDDFELVHALPLTFTYSVRYTPHVHRGMAKYLAVR